MSFRFFTRGKHAERSQRLRYLRAVSQTIFALVYGVTAPLGIAKSCQKKSNEKFLYNHYLLLSTGEVMRLVCFVSPAFESRAHNVGQHPTILGLGRKPYTCGKLSRLLPFPAQCCFDVSTILESAVQTVRHTACFVIFINHPLSWIGNEKP